MIKYKDLSSWLKFAIVMSLIQAGANIMAFFVFFLGALSV
jgi:hypothetical protein